MGAAVVSALLAGLAGLGMGQTIIAAPPTAPRFATPPVPLVGAHPVALTRVVFDLPQAQPYLVIQAGMFCAANKSLVWTGAPTEQKLGQYVTPFRTEMAKGAIPTEGDPANLFERETDAHSSAEFAVGARIVGLKLRACVSPARGGGAAEAKGEADMQVEWQLFSRLSRQVVARIETQGHIELAQPTPAGLALLNSGVFAANADRLAASPQFRDAITSQGAAVATAAPGASQPRIPLQGALSAPTQSMAAAAGSVVVVYAGDGEGSGFLVSRDGYILTDAHVVGGASRVRLRWADGKESIGDVVRVSRERDVALIKADAGGRTPLALRLQPPSVGETVFAIGSPLNDRFQGTVTRGVVSAERTFDGMAYLQSDITVNPGNSGGPLLDEQGRVVALTRAGVRLNAAPTGINLFIPAHDAVEVLALDRD